MRFLRTKTLLFCLAALVVGAGSASAAPKGAAVDPHTILVKFDRAAHSVVVKVTSGESVDDALAAYRSNPNVAYAEANVIEQAQDISAPNDPSYSAQWSLAKTNALGGWSAYPGSYALPSTPQPSIAIVDTGIASAHPDFGGRVDTADGANCLTGTCVSSTALDDEGHGTHVAGIAAASANNLTGIAGVAYDAPVIPVKVLDFNGSGSASGVAAGIIWAADRGARVINTSLGSTAYSQTVCDAVTYATSKSAIVVAAAGNNGSATPFYPAACPGAIGVGATDSTDAVPYWSNTGSANVFVSAPGVGILSTYIGGGYQTMSGTSMAAPFVAGLAELLFAQNPSRTVGDVERILASTSDKVGGSSYGSDPKGTCTSCTWNSSYGYGRVDVRNALTGTTGPDFAVVASPASLSTTQGGSATSTISLSNLNGFKGTVSLSASGAPSGTTAKLSRTSVSGTTTATLTLTTTTSTPAGSYTVTLTGVSGSLRHTTTLTLAVAQLVPEFALSASPVSYTKTHGRATSLAYKVTITPRGGFKGTVSLAAGGTPSNMTGKWSAASVAITGTSAASATYTVSVPATATVGTWTITVTATSGSITHTLTLTLTLT